MHTQKERKKQGEKKFELLPLFHLQIDEVHDRMVRVGLQRNTCASIWNTRKPNDQTQKQ